MKSEWKECSIADLGEVVGGATPSTKNPDNYANGNISWITPKDLSTHTGRYICKGERNITEKGLNSCSTRLLPVNSVLFSSRAPIGYVAIAGQELCTNQGFKSVVPNSATDYMFLYYLLEYNKENIENMGSGTTFKEVSGNTMKSIKVSVPVNIDEQKRIASVLSVIDDKIELNNEINKNLEQQAQALSDKWVAEHLDCITMRPLTEVAEINPDTYSPKDKWAFVNYLDTSSITNGVMSDIQLINPDTEKLPSRARRIIKANDIVYSTVRPNQLHFGIISNPLDNMLASTGFAVIRSKYDYISSPYIYHFLTSPDFIEKMQQLAEQSTSTFPSVKPSDIGTCLIPYADETEMLDVTDKINGMYALVSANHQENKRLAVLRDTLLPKLMNGEIDVSAVKI